MEEKNLYKKYNEGRHWEKHPTIYAEDFVEFLENNNFKGLIVDAGCGNGRDLEIFHNVGYENLGIDYSNKEIENAKRLHPNLIFEIQNIEKMNFKNGEVSAFFCINVIHYVNKKKALGELFRCLKKNGYLFIHFNIEIRDKDGKVDYKHNEEDILELVSDFKIVRKKVMEREDTIPIKHRHKIMGLILQKK